MHSDKAADVRDSLNALPCVASDDGVNEHNYGDEPKRLRHRRSGEKAVYAGPVLDTGDFTFSPAKIHEAGEIAVDGGPMRPCYEVLLEPLTIPTRPLPSVSIPPAVVHEVAKHGCRLRVLSGYRGEWTPGVIRIRDDLAHEEQPDDRERCDRCGCVRFELRDGTPTCAQCGETAMEQSATNDRVLEDYA